MNERKDKNNDRYASVGSGSGIFLSKLAYGLGYSQIAGILSNVMEFNFSVGNSFCKSRRGLA